MPPSKRGKVDGAAPPDADGDLISALPDDALHHVLSFLPAEDSVRTSVLARRWRHLWKSATGLRISFGHGNEPPCVEKFRHFVTNLLLLRRRDSSLHTCELSLWRDRTSMRSDWLQGDKLGLSFWVRHIVDCEVRILRLEIPDPDPNFRFDMLLPFASQHLRSLTLVGVALTNSLCNFSNCPNLENLEFAQCDFYWVQEILSESLKRLSFGSYCYFDKLPDWNTFVWTPSLVSLRLDMHFCGLPVLGSSSMPSLKEAFLRDSIDNCDVPDCYTCKHDDDELAGYNNQCVLLEGLSKAENLTLMSDCNGAYFRRDLKWCPTFNNLRTLLLNEWDLNTNWN